MKRILIISLVAVILFACAGVLHAVMDDSWRPYNEPSYTTKQSKGEYVLLGCVKDDPSWQKQREALKPVLMEYMSRNSNITPYKIDCNQQGALCAKLGVTQVPTILLMKNKKEKGRIQGASCNPAEFSALLNKAK